MEDAWKGNGWTERGKELEAEAIAKYEFLTGETVERIGFCTTDDGRFGASPDGLVGDHGLVEIKVLKAENHAAAILYYRKHKKVPTEYVQQTQGQMMVTGRRWADSVFYNPVLPMLIIRQEPIFSVVAGLTSGIKALLAERDSIVAALREAR